MDAEPWFRPLEVEHRRPARLHFHVRLGVFAGGRIEVHAGGADHPDRGQFRRAAHRAIGRRFPGADRFAFFRTGFSSRVFIARRGQVGDSEFGHFLDRDRDRPVLEEGLFEVADVVDDHVGTGTARGDRLRQLADVFGELESAAVGGGEGELGLRGDVVDHLHIARPSSVRGPSSEPGGGASAITFTGTCWPLQVLDSPGRSLVISSPSAVLASGPTFDRGGRRAEGIGDHADRQPVAPGAEGGAGGRHVQLGDALADHRAAFAAAVRFDRRGAERFFGAVEDRLPRRGDEVEARHFAHRGEVFGGDREGHRLVAAACRQHFGARRFQRFDPCQGAGFEAGFDDHPVAFADDAARPCGRQPAASDWASAVAPSSAAAPSCASSGASGPQPSSSRPPPPGPRGRSTRARRRRARSRICEGASSKSRYRQAFPVL